MWAWNIVFKDPPNRRGINSILQNCDLPENITAYLKKNQQNFLIKELVVRGHRRGIAEGL
jgi:hypothetical protein